MKIGRRRFAGAMMSGVIGATEMLRASGRAPKVMPNIIIIMADDMGYSDIGCYGGEISTPNIDRLAAGGIRFRNFYNTARCCPTRASLLTGLYPHQAGLGWMTAGMLEGPGYYGELNKQCVTIAEVLRERGYGTYISGKWHVTGYWNLQGADRSSWPVQRGFDRFFGTLRGAGSYWKPSTLMLDNDPVEPVDDFYYTDEISDHTCKIIEEHVAQAPGKPFFNYVAYTAPHWPLHAKPEDIEKYKDFYSVGWDSVRQSRYERMKKMGVIPSDMKLSARNPDVPAWNTLDAEDQKLFARRMAVYAAQVDCMDQGIGRIVDTLKATGQLENTLIMFLADNGASGEGFMNPRTTVENMGSPESNGSYYLHWANVSNTPFRMHKQYTHEGGVLSPMVAHWPEKISRRGEFSDQHGHVIDLMATVVDVSGAQYPEEFAGNRIAPMEGISLYNAMVKDWVKPRPLFFEHQSSRAVRVGDWKLVSLTKESPWELYNLANDRSEGVNLAEQYPEKVKELAVLWTQFAKRAGVLPLDDRGWTERVNASKKKQAK